MPVVNEERHLEAAVRRILEQDYRGSLHVTMAVGPSKDHTLEVAQRLAEADPDVHVVENPSGKTPAGLNAAIASRAADIVVRVDGHAMIPNDYVRVGVETLQRTGADNVGGLMAAEGVSPFERAVAQAMRSRFGVGDASFHVGGDEGPALTVYLGCFRSSALERVGGFDESMVRAQDWELNLRIRNSGGTVWFTPKMAVTYRPRSTPSALARQYHDYGRWRREVVRRHPETVSLRYLAAPITVAVIALGVLLALVGIVLGQSTLVLLGLVPAAVYLVGNLVASFWTAITQRVFRIPVFVGLPVAFAVMHGAWGAGFLRGAKGQG
jgi:cellulose synthase/poly-beta-1,6-N-acetylglucosamine synthase-like glycosyltransferase